MAYNKLCDLIFMIT